MSLWSTPLRRGGPGFIEQDIVKVSPLYATYNVTNTPVVDHTNQPTTRTWRMSFIIAQQFASQ